MTVHAISKVRCRVRECVRNRSARCESLVIRFAAFKAVVFALLATASTGMGAGPAVEVSLHSAVAVVAPGATFDVGIQFKVPMGWHIYWKNPGDSGLPTRVNWELPPEFEVGRLRFPAPRRHLELGDLSTNVLAGEFVLLQTFTAPKTLEPGEKVTLVAEVQWLACKTACVPGRAVVSAELPVAVAPANAGPIQAALLERARRALPTLAEEGKRLEIAPSSAIQTAHPGQSFEVVLDITITAGSHVQSNQPSAGLISTHVFLERDPGLVFGKVKYPPPEERVDPHGGRLSEYRGTVSILIPVQVRDDAEGRRIRVGGVLSAQASDDTSGTRYPPEHLAWELELPLAGAVAASADSAASEGGSADADSVRGDQPTHFLMRWGLPGLLLGCFVYGLLINLTPCVLPLLSIKVLGFVQHAHEARRRTLLLGLAFGVGVLLFFVILGFVAAAGRNVLQYPVAVILLGAVVTALSLSMLGVYTLQVPTAATKLDAAIQKEGLGSSFGKGALAPVLGFACTGPLLGFAFAWATQQPPRIAIFAFLSAGLGMASPYVLLGAFPHWLSFLPKPGQWMITFERIMGFLLLGMVVLLIHPLITLIGTGGLEWTLAFLVAVALACWLLGRVNLSMSTALRWRYRGGAAVIVLGAAALIYGVIFPLGEAQGRLHYAGGNDWSKGIPWRAWSLRETVRAGNTVFVDLTSAYCTVCKQNKLVAVDTPEVRARMEALGVVPLQGDFTSGDPEIKAMLDRYDRPGVPLNLIYPAGKPDAPIVLRPNLTKKYLLEKLDQAGPSSDSPGTTTAR